MTLIWLVFWAIMCLFLLSIGVALLCTDSPEVPYSQKKIHLDTIKRVVILTVFILAIISYTSAVIEADCLVFHHTHNQLVYKMTHAR